MQKTAIGAAMIAMALVVGSCTPGTDRQEDIATSETVDTNVVSGTLGFGFPCNADTECAVNACEPHLQQTLCSRACDANVACPDGWTCGDSGVCVSTFLSLCRPCASDAQCGSAPGTACIDYGVASFCGIDCLEDPDCPDGYRCRAERTFTGEPRTTCVRDVGICPCTAAIEASGTPAICKNQNVYGVCLGERSCKDGRWTECGAVDPAPDYPNGIDDDCNGTTDDISCLCGDGVCDAGCDETLETCPCDCAVEGDGICSPCGENPVSAPVDCCKGPFGTSGCGDGFCIGFTCGEDPDTCANDCGTPCGDGICQPGENPFNCEQDCLLKVCGNGICEGPDGGPEACPQDCAEFCGNCECEPDEGEVVFNCPIDCGYCGDGICAVCDALNEDPVTCPADCCDEGVEICNGLDDDCDGEVDEIDALGCQLHYIDSDGDGLGTSGSGRCLCDADETHTSTIPGDCDDTTQSVGLGNPEICDGLDNDCDGATDENFNIGAACDTGVPCQIGATVCETVSTTRCGAGTNAPAGTLCGEQQCSGAGIQQQRRCSSNGLCNTGLVTGCNGYLCANDGDGPYCETSCQQNPDCAQGAICDASNRCVTPLTTGDPCTRTSQCVTGLTCSDGVCCDSPCDGDCETCASPNNRGTCVPEGPGTDPSNDCPECQSCNGQRACSPVEDGTDPSGDCTVSYCSLGKILIGTCKAGMCGADVLSDCNNDLGCEDDQTCRTNCLEDNDCLTDHYCLDDGTGCASRKPLGDDCTSDNACQNGMCVDGVCCESACDGVCAECDTFGECVAAATDTACVSPDRCIDIGVCMEESFPDICVDNMDCDPSFCVFPFSGGDGTCCEDAGCTGPCETCNDPRVFGRCSLLLAVESADCDQNNWCDATGECRPKVGSSCSSGVDCPSGHYCDATTNQCDTGALNGSPCDGNDRCQSNICARNGVCCSQRCDGVCEACDPGGICRSKMPGEADDDCAGDLVCNGTGQCGQALGNACGPGMPCAGGICVDGTCCANSCGTCQHCRADGLACEPVPTGTRTAGCDGDFVCTDEGGGNTSCTLEDGSRCTLAIECQSQICDPLIPGLQVCCSDSCESGEWCANSAGLFKDHGQCRLIEFNACVAGECPDGYYCDDGNLCRRLGSEGDICDNGANPCEASYTCVDGVCCDNPCNGQCESCNQTGSVGLCTSITGDEPMACTGDFSCFDGDCLRENGVPCQNASQCGDNFCTDGRCCTVGFCTGCSACGPSGGCEDLSVADVSCPSGRRCPGAGCIASNGLGNIGDTCAGDDDCLDGNCPDGVCCDVACDWACEECSTGSCQPLPDLVEDPGFCESGQVCISGACMVEGGSGALGDDCQSELNCLVGLKCKDDVCCESICTNECYYCNDAGMCVPTADGDPDDDTCPVGVCMGGSCAGCMGDACP